MKNNKNYPVLLALVAIVFFGSCARTKPTKSTLSKNNSTINSQAKNTKEKPISNKTQEVDTKTTVVTKEKVVTETTSVTTETPEKVFTPTPPTPPEKVAAIFKKEYPAATTSIWNQMVPEGKNGKMYLVSFLLGSNRNSAIFNENGIEIERRSEILPDQLPQTIYDAIKSKYKDAEIISATTFHSTLLKGNYAAKVKSESFAIVSEFILTDKGEFIEQ